MNKEQYKYEEWVSHVSDFELVECKRKAAGQLPSIYAEGVRSLQEWIDDCMDEYFSIMRCE